MHASCEHTVNITHKDSGSHKVQHYLNAISLKIEVSLLTIDGPPKYSADLEWAAAAQSIGVEFLGGPSILSQLQRCENAAFHIHAAPFGIRSRSRRPKGRSSAVRAVRPFELVGMRDGAVCGGVWGRRSYPSGPVAR